ncbi:MAG: hypothetical protein AAF490_12300 [Chloroflexota bacterium]
METRGSFNRLEWLLGILLVILLIIVVVLSIVFWFSPDAPNAAGNLGPAQNSATTVAQNASQIGPTPVFQGNTALIAYLTAEKLAQTWSTDAQLLNANATWSQGATVANLQSGKTTWAFTFFSKQAQKATTISVIENQANFVAEAPSPIDYSIHNISTWQIDSNDAIQILLDQGGYNFINQEGVTILTMSLMADMGTPSQQMEWFVSLIGTESGNSIDVRLNANTGEVLELSNVQ